MQIGKLTAELPKAVKGNQYTGKMVDRNGADNQKPKYEALEEAGIKQDTAGRFERIAKYPEAVEKAKEEARQELTFHRNL